MNLQLITLSSPVSIPQPVLWRDRAKSSWMNSEMGTEGARAAEKARRYTEARRDPFSPTTQIHGLCSRSQSEEVLGWVLYTMASKITQLAFDELDAPPVVLLPHCLGPSKATAG